MTRYFLGTMMVLGGCTAGGGDVETFSEALSLTECSRDSDCARGEVCADTEHGSYCSNGDRCTSSRDCPLRSVCRGQCLTVEVDAERPESCPRGSRPGRVVCAPGFEAITLSRDPACTTCEPTRATVDRCDVSAVDPERCRRMFGGGDEEPTVEARCRAAGYTLEECHRLLAAAESDDDTDVARRCRAAGISPERCRYLTTGEDEPTFAERCRAAGYSEERCRHLISGEGDDPTFAERCRAAGYSEERCRALAAD